MPQPPRNRHVYGRKTTTRENDVAAKLFAAGSSSPVVHLDEVKSVSNTEENEIVVELNEAEDVVLQIEKLSISDKTQPQRERRNGENKIIQARRKPLKERDGNTVEQQISWKRVQKAKKAKSGGDYAVDGDISDTIYGREVQLLGEYDIRLDRNASQLTLQSACKEEQIETQPTDATPPQTRTRRTRQNATESCPTSTLVSHIQPLIDLCRDSGGTRTTTPFQTWADSIDEFFNITKIAEASYGEVYRLCLRDAKSGLKAADESVLKLIALKPPPKPGATKESAKVAAMSAVCDVASEIRLLQCMSSVPGFTNFREVRVVRGRLPRQFVKAWRAWNTNVKKSLFPDPGRKTTHDEDQLWAIIEMQDAGSDLEAVKCENVWMAWDAFWGVAVTLAKGEEWARFEHRDLHLGNICVRLPGKKEPPLIPYSSPVTSSRRLGFTGLETTIIDYTLSRADIPSSPLASPSSSFSSTGSRSKVGQTVLFDLSKDPIIFCGDSSEDYQYAIYRHMRSAVLNGDPCADTDPPAISKGQTGSLVKRNAEADAWQEYHPITNLVWLHFVLYKLMQDVVVWPSTAQQLAYGDLALKLERRLKTLQRVLALEGMSEMGLGSAGELVGWAVESGWLHEEDVCG